MKKLDEKRSIEILREQAAWLQKRGLKKQADDLRRHANALEKKALLEK